MDALIFHEKGGISLHDFHPGSAENPFCSFSGRFVVEDDGGLVPDQVAQTSCCSAGGNTGGAVSQSCGCGVPGEDLLVSPPEIEITHEIDECCCSSGNEPEPAKSSCCCGSDAQKEAVPGADVARARRYVADQWSCADEEDDTDDPSFAAFDAVLKRRARTLGLSAMVFQDAWTLDLERLRQCYIHVMMPDQKAVPFCAFNLTDREGRSLYRKEEGC